MQIKMLKINIAGESVVIPNKFGYIKKLCVYIYRLITLVSLTHKMPTINYVNIKSDRLSKTFVIWKYVYIFT